MKKFVPKNFEHILETLIQKSIPFDEREILEEIEKGIIKNSPRLENLIKKNKDLISFIDSGEYGWETSVEKFRKILNENRAYARFFAPIIDEYFANFSKNNFKAVEYSAINTLGFAILSKLKNNENMDFGLKFEISPKYSGDINNLYTKVIFSSSIAFKESDKKIDFVSHNPESIKKLYGNQEFFSLEQKAPFLHKLYDAYISVSDDKSKIIAVDYNKVTEIIGIMRENVQKRIDLFDLYSNSVRYN